MYMYYTDIKHNNDTEQQNDTKHFTDSLITLILLLFYIHGNIFFCLLGLNLIDVPGTNQY